MYYFIIGKYCVITVFTFSLLNFVLFKPEVSNTKYFFICFNRLLWLLWIHGLFKNEDCWFISQWAQSGAPLYTGFFF